MSAAAAIGERVRLAGYALAGVDVHAAEDEDEAMAAWEGLPADVACLILTESSHAALADRLAERSRLLWTVVPS